MRPYGKLKLWDMMCQVEIDEKNYDRFHGMDNFKETFVPLDLFDGAELLEKADREHFVWRLDTAMTQILERLGVDLSRLNESEKETEG